MNHGYVCVHLYSGGKKTRVVKTIHQLVAQVFIPNPQGHREVNHKNFLRRDNRVDNLEWVSRKENVAHAIAAGRRVKPEKRVMGINLRTKGTVRFESQIAAEIALRGKQTGGISGAMKRGKPAYGYVWWFA
jgi:predicted GIY-YIG superfamily endonuclease